jgi:hypothetical protein
MRFFYDQESFGEPTWICIYAGCYMQTSTNLFCLIYKVITEYKDDKHLVG